MRTDDGRMASVGRLALVLGVGGVAVALAGLAVPGCPPHVFRAWLVAFNLFTGAAVGSLVVLMLQYLTGGTWGLILRPTLEAATRTLPLMAALFVPVAFGMDYVYEWSRFQTVHHEPELADDPLYAGLDPHDHELEHKMPLLNRTFFYVRAALYFALWGVLVFLLNRWSAELERRRDPSVVERCAYLAAPGLLLYVLSVSFASIDWGMSLEPYWYSTIYPAMFGMGQVLTGMAVCVATLALLAYREDVGRGMNGQPMSDLGTLLGAFVMIWAYLSFMQFLIIWMGQVPEELPWYGRRMLADPWRAVAIALLVFGFAVPFALLMSPDVKRDRRSLAGVALLVCATRAVDLVWLLVPGFSYGREMDAFPAFGYAVYAGALVGVGGLWVSTFLWQLGRRPILPTYSPEEAAHGEAAHA